MNIEIFFYIFFILFYIKCGTDTARYYYEDDVKATLSDRLFIFTFWWFAEMVDLFKGY